MEFLKHNSFSEILISTLKGYFQGQLNYFKHLKLLNQMWIIKYFFLTVSLPVIKSKFTEKGLGKVGRFHHIINNVVLLDNALPYLYEIIYHKKARSKKWPCS